MNEKYKRVCRALNYFKHFLIFVAAVSGCISISAFASLVQIAIGFMTSAVGFTICVIAAEI